MQRKVNKYLFDIRTCIEKINRYVGSPQIYSDYEKDFMLREAVERNLEIIGEAMNSILKIEPTISITNAREIVNTETNLSTVTTRYNQFKSGTL